MIQCGQSKTSFISWLCKVNIHFYSSKPQLSLKANAILIFIMETRQFKRNTLKKSLLLSFFWQHIFYRLIQPCLKTQKCTKRGFSNCLFKNVDKEAITSGLLIRPKVISKIHISDWDFRVFQNLCINEFFNYFYSKFNS